VEYLAASRWPHGFVCPVCEGRRAWVLERRHLWECVVCHAQTSVTAGAVMHGTRTPLRLWFWAAYLVATHHPGISARQLQRQLGLSRYETAWLILQKLRRAMVAPEREPLEDEVEVDELYLGGEQVGLKGGRQRGKKALVGVVIEVRGAGSGRVRPRVLEDASMESLNDLIESTTAPGAIVHTDGWRGYWGLGKLGYEYRPRKKEHVLPGEELLPRGAPRRVKPQSPAARHPPRGRRPPPPGLPRRIRLPPQPAADPDGRVPDALGPRSTAPAHHLSPDHPPRTSGSLSEPDTH
jgi:hypothetical protein